VRPDHRGLQAPRATRAVQLVPQARRALLVFPAWMAPLAPPGQLEQQAPLVCRERQGRRAKLVQLVYKGPQAQQVRLGQMVAKGPKASRGLLAYPALLVLQVRLDQKAPAVLQVLLASLERPVLMALQVQKVLRALPVQQAHGASLAPRGPQAQPGHKV
jgi:hypothetical protein